MNFRRVFTGTALVAVLLSSLFSGWLTNSPSLIKPPVAQAQTGRTLSEICTGSSSTISVTADWSASIPVVAMVTVLSNRVGSSNFEASLYRSYNIPPGKYGDPISTAAANGASFVRMTDTPPEGSFTYFVQITEPSGGKKCSAESSRYESTGSSTGGSHASYAKWFEDIDRVEIFITDRGADTPPPAFVYAKKTEVSRPKLQFDLSSGEIEGSWVVNSVKWLFFSASEVSSSGTLTPIPGLYFVTSDNAPRNNYFIYAPAMSIRDIVASGLQSSNARNLKTVNINVDSVIRVFDYIMDVPKGGGYNCQSGEGVYLTGPASTDGKTVPDIIRNHPTEGLMTNNTTGSFANNSSGLNINCLDKTSTGWPAKWGLKITDASSGKGDCSISAWNIATSPIGNTMIKVIACAVGGLIDSIITPLVDGAERFTGTENPIEEQIKDPTNGLVIGWKYSLSLINILVILALLVIAFANVLHLNLNTYAAKKALPGLVIGVVGANASLLIIRFVLDVVQALIRLSYQVAGTGVDSQGDLAKAFIDIIGGSTTKVDYAALVATPFSLFIVIIAVIYFIFLFVMLAFALIKRLVWLYGLIIVAPLAFIAYGIPSMSQWFNKWWDQFIRQAFVLPVLFLGIAFFVNYGKEIGMGVNYGEIEGEGIPPNLLMVLLTLAAATAILKIPGAISKGMYDMEAMSKKAFGLAKNAPATAWGGAQGLAGNKVSKLAQRRERLEKAASHSESQKTASGAARAARLRVEAERIGRSEKRYKSVRDASGAMRGRAYTIANPEKTVSKWWEARTAAGEKASSLEASKINVGAGPVKGNISDIVSGRAGGYSSKRDIARKIFMEEVSSPEEALEAAAASKDTIKAIENVLRTMTPDKAMKLRRSLAGAKKEEDMRKVQQQLIDAGVKPSDLLRKGLFPEGQLSAFYEYIVRESRRKNVTTDDSEPDRHIQGWVKPLGSYDTNDNPPDRPPDNPPSGSGFDPSRGDRAVATASFIRSDVADQVKNTVHDISGQYRKVFEALNSGGLDGAGVSAEQQKLVDLRNKSLTAMTDSMVEGGADLVADFNNHTDDEVAQMMEHMSTAFKNEVHFENVNDLAKQQQLKSALQTGHTNSVAAQGVNREATQAVGGMSDEDWDRLGQSQAELVGHLSNNLVGPMVSKLGAMSSNSNPEQMKNLTKSITDTLTQAVAGRGKNSIRSILQSGVANLGGTISKELDMHQISTGSIAAAMNQARGATQQAPNQNVSSPDITVNVDAGQPTAPIAPPQVPETPAQPTASEPAPPPPEEPSV